jgi:uncharacterized repeat protein (TIGR01451 family)
MKRQFTVLCLAGSVALLKPTDAGAATFPANFQEATIFSGLTQPTAVKFASDGRIFVAEKSGLIKVYSSLTATTPTIFADLRTNVHNYWDRGLLGLELHPNFPATPYVYVLYTLDRKPGGTIPTWGTPGATSDGCPNPPGATTSGCAVTGRLSRLAAAGDVMTGSEQVLIEDWCQQFPSHSIGNLAFGADGALYASGGDGASFNNVDYGQYGGTGGIPVNVCGDPPVPVGGTQTPPTAEGGALRSESLQRGPSEPVVLGGAILRLNPDTGAALPDNPLFNHNDPNARRIVAYGLRNPFRFAPRPGTSEIWVGDVGWNNWEEINRIESPTSSVVNFGWPCYEGVGRQGGYDAANLNICENLYSANGAVADPYFTYLHSDKIVPGETCATGSSAIAGLAFYQGGNYPTPYQGALFFTDYNRRCIWAMMPDGAGTPDPARIITFGGGLTGGAVALQTGPGGDLFYADFDGGRIQRIRYFPVNQPPIAVATADQSAGPAPLTVQFDGSGSSDPDGDALSYAWDLNGDGLYDDSSQVRPVYTYENPGTYTVRLKVTDPAGANATAMLTITADNTPPTASIATPAPSLTWKVGDVISFSGSASDQQQGTLPASALSWKVILQHCPSNCHEHLLQTFSGVASGSFPAPDHEYPSYLELRLTATDAGGLTDMKSVSLQPQTVSLTLQTAPSGLQVAFNGTSEAAPFARTVIVGSNNTVSAPSPQTVDGVPYGFWSWSDGGAASHNIIAPASAATYQATYKANADLAVVQSAAPNPVTVGDLLTYTVTVSNGGPGQQTGVTLVDTLPGGVSFVSASPGPPTCAAAGGTVTCALGTLAASGSTSVTIVVRPTTAGSLTNSARASGGEPDPNAANDTATAVVTANPQPAISINDISVNEGDAGTVNAVFTVSLSAASSQTVTVGYATADSSATAGSDYVAVSGLLSFAPGSLTRAISVLVIGDTTKEKPEQFLVNLSGATNASIADAQGQGRIFDNDKGKPR